MARVKSNWSETGETVLKKRGSDSSYFRGFRAAGCRMQNEMQNNLATAQHELQPRPRPTRPCAESDAPAALVHSDRAKTTGRQRGHRSFPDSAKGPASSLIHQL